MTGGRAAYPGTFDPPTVAHLAIAEAALRQGGLERVELLVSEVPLGKDRPLTPLPVRLTKLAEAAAGMSSVAVAASHRQLLSEIASEYDALVLGADKWAQVLDPRWYGGSVAARDEALASLPRVLIAPRPPHPLDQTTLPAGALVLVLDRGLAEVSSSAVRAGRSEWLATKLSTMDVGNQRG